LVALVQCGATTGPQATCGPRMEFLRPTSFLSIVCCVYRAVGNFTYNKHNIFL